MLCRMDVTCTADDIEKVIKTNLSMINNFIKGVKMGSIKVSVNYEKSQHKSAKCNMQFRGPSGAITECKVGVM